MQQQTVTGVHCYSLVFSFAVKIFLHKSQSHLSLEWQNAYCPNVTCKCELYSPATYPLCNEILKAGRIFFILAVSKQVHVS